MSDFTAVEWKFANDSFNLGHYIFNETTNIYPYIILLVAEYHFNFIWTSQIVIIWDIIHIQASLEIQNTNNAFWKILATFSTEIDFRFCKFGFFAKLFGHFLEISSGKPCGNQFWAKFERVKFWNNFWEENYSKLCFRHWKFVQLDSEWLQWSQQSF